MVGSTSARQLLHSIRHVALPRAQRRRCRRHLRGLAQFDAAERQQRRAARRGAVQRGSARPAWVAGRPGKLQGQREREATGQDAGGLARKRALLHAAAGTRGGSLACSDSGSGCLLSWQGWLERRSHPPPLTAVAPAAAAAARAAGAAAWLLLLRPQPPLRLAARRGRGHGRSQRVGRAARHRRRGAWRL